MRVIPGRRILAAARAIVMPHPGAAVAGIGRPVLTGAVLARIVGHAVH